MGGGGCGQWASTFDFFDFMIAFSSTSFHFKCFAEEPSQAKRVKVDVESATESTESVRLPVMISDALANFFGTGEREMFQSEAFRRIWEYIKVNHLEVGSHL